MIKDDIVYLQQALGVEDDGIIGPITRTAYANRIITIASKESGVRETSKNQGPGIQKYWLSTWYEDGYENREPWCAAFVDYVIHQSKCFREDKRPKTPAAFGLETWGRTIDLQVIKEPAIIKAGDICVFSFSHVGIASEDSHLHTYMSWEGNTNAAGSREGNGVFHKTRSIGTVRSVIRL